MADNQNSNADWCDASNLKNPRWTDGDLIHGVLTLRRTRAGHMQNVPLNAEAKHLLERAIETPAMRPS
jgi:hypothetical protein